MTVVGFNFTKMSAEKSKPVKGRVDVSNNVSIKNVSQSNLSVTNNRKALKIDFAYVSKYDPGIGKIDLFGELVYLVDENTSRDMLDKWKKEKKLTDDVMKGVMNQILAKCNVQAVVLSRDINLPAPIPLPKMK